MAIRTRVLAHQAATVAINANHLLYTCPAGHTAIVKHWVLTQDSGVTGILATGLRRNNLLTWFWTGNPAYSGQPYGPGLCYVVLQPGDELWFRIVVPAGNAGIMATHVSGSLFAGVAV